MERSTQEMLRTTEATFLQPYSAQIWTGHLDVGVALLDAVGKGAGDAGHTETGRASSSLAMQISTSGRSSFMVACDFSGDHILPR